MSTSVLFVNIGTPTSPTPQDVGTYLQEFLYDPDVISLPNPLRWVLVNWLIVPRRKHQSAEAYEKVWMKEGSPLKVYTDSLVEKVNAGLSDDVSFRSAMRYGNESLAELWPQFKDQERVVVLPAFPQNAMATSGSVIKRCKELQKQHGFPENLEFLSDFYQDDFFIESLVQSIQGFQRDPEKSYDHLLFSYHGLPKSHVVRDDPHPGTCQQKENCCELAAQAEGGCYRAQCIHTTKAVVQKLGLSRDDYSVSFQSRLGRAEWLKPYTVDKVEEIAQRGVRRLAVVCPAFVVDCLETLEEIAMGVREDFIAAGGEELFLIPCLNDESEWAQRLAKHIHHSLQSK